MKKTERKYLEISTAHLKQKTLKGLNAMEQPYIYEYEEGIFIKYVKNTRDFSHGMN